MTEITGKDRRRIPGTDRDLEIKFKISTEKGPEGSAAIKKGKR